MRLSKRRLAWVCASLLVIAGYAAPAAQAPGKHFLWKVTSPDGHEAYLLGSVHVLSKSFYPLSPVIDQAFAASKTLVEEIDLDEMNDPGTMAGLMGKAMLPAGQTLDQVVSKETYAAVQKRAEANGLPVQMLQHMWYHSALRAVRSPDPINGCDPCCSGTRDRSPGLFLSPPS